MPRAAVVGEIALKAHILDGRLDGGAHVIECVLLRREAKLSAAKFTARGGESVA
ncbi:MAG: hypothetical protein IJC18_04715 [Clostridia bacterium]|nr:hypothetical protein [Clostridia bacterium]